jgi:hypothetical protein
LCHQRFDPDEVFPFSRSTVDLTPNDAPSQQGVLHVKEHLDDLLAVQP